MIAAIRYARENRVPYLGICLGMQMAVVEFARHVAGLGRTPTPREFTTRTAHPVIDLMPDQVGVTDKGGTMRLGRYPCVAGRGQPGPGQAYGTAEIFERAPPSLRVQQRVSGRQLQAGGARCSPVCPRTGSWWRSWRSRDTRGLWGVNSTRSFSAGRTGRTRCFGGLWRRRWRSDGAFGLWCGGVRTPPLFLWCGVRYKTGGRTEASAPTFLL